MLQNFTPELAPPSFYGVAAPQLPPDGLGETLRLFKRHRVALAIWIVFCMALSLFYAMTAPKEYSATAQLILDSRRLLQGLDQNAYAPMTIDNPQVESQVQIAKSEQVLRYVFNELKLATDPEFAVIEKPGLLSRLFAKPESATNGEAKSAEAKTDAAAFAAFSDRVTARRVGQSLVLEISFRSLSAARAAKIANGVADAFIRYQIESRVLEVRRAGDWLQSRTDDLSQQEEVAVDAIRDGVAPRFPLAASPVQFISEASKPLNKAYPQTSLLLLTALTFSLLTGLGFLSIRQGLDRTIRTRRQIRDVAAVECLGVTPCEPQIKDASLSSMLCFLRIRPGSGFTRSLDMAASALLSDHRTKPPRIVGVMPCSPGAGSSTIAAALAMQIAARGHKTALANLASRKSGRLWRFDTEEARPLVGGEVGYKAPFGGNLQFLDLIGLCSTPYQVGSVEKSIPVRLGDRLAPFEHVLIDFPALREGSDVLRHADLLDGVVLVVEYGKTSLDEVSEVIHALCLTETMLLGVVLNRAPQDS